VREIVTFEQQRFTCELCKRIGKAIAEIQLGRMAAAFAEIAIGLPCNSSLGFGHRFNNDLRLFDEVIEASAGDRVTACVYEDRGFHEISGGHTAGSAILDRTRAGSSRRIAISADVPPLAKCNGDGGCHAFPGQLRQLVCDLVRFPILDVQAHDLAIYHNEETFYHPCTQGTQKKTRDRQASGDTSHPKRLRHWQRLVRNI
jgi:hypothetical protein